MSDLNKNSHAFPRNVHRLLSLDSIISGTKPSQNRYSNASHCAFCSAISTVRVWIFILFFFFFLKNWQTISFCWKWLSINCCSYAEPLKMPNVIISAKHGFKKKVTSSRNCSFRDTLDSNITKLYNNSGNTVNWLHLYWFFYFYFIFLLSFRLNIIELHHWKNDDKFFNEIFRPMSVLRLLAF